MLKKTLIVFLIVLPLTLIADPSPFGLDIGKSTIKDVKEKYPLEYKGINKYSGGKKYSIDTHNLQFEGLLNVNIIFGKNEKLLAVLTTLDKRKFDPLYNSLRRKYQLVSKKIPFVGTKIAKFIDGKTEITLNAPHMSFVMEMNYINQDFLKKFKVLSNQEEQQKQLREQSQL